MYFKKKSFISLINALTNEGTNIAFIWYVLFNIIKDIVDSENIHKIGLYTDI